MKRKVAFALAACLIAGGWNLSTGLAAQEQGAAETAPPQAVEGESAGQAVVPAPEKPGTAASTDQAEAEKEPAPVTGAFGIALGERFHPCMVEKVLGQEEKAYESREKEKRTGTRYQVVPRTANERFESYFVNTTEQGLIYSIQGESTEGGDEKACKKITGRIAELLEEKYGKARSKGLHGEWYAFRDMSVNDYRGIRLYANRCGTGRYTIVYSDDSARRRVLPAEEPKEPGESDGL